MVISVIILIPFSINVAGWNLYAHCFLGANTVIISSKDGLSHTSCRTWDTVYQDDASSTEAIDDTGVLYYDYELIDIGPINIYSNTRENSMTPFIVRLIKPTSSSDFRGFEFPWLLFLLIPSSILLKRSKTSRTRCTPIHYPPRV